MSQQAIIKTKLKIREQQEEIDQLRDELDKTQTACDKLGTRIYLAYTRGGTVDSLRYWATTLLGFADGHFDGWIDEEDER